MHSFRRFHSPNPCSEVRRKATLAAHVFGGVTAVVGCRAMWAQPSAKHADTEIDWMVDASGNCASGGKDYVQRYILLCSAEEDVQRRWKGGLQSCGRYGKLMLAGDVANTQQQLKSAVIHPEFGGRKEAACV